MNRHHFSVKTCAVLLSVAILLSCVGCFSESGHHQALLEELISPLTAVFSSAEVIGVLSEQAEDYGYDNALSELSTVGSTSIDGDTYYRLQQNYNGLPVYGRTAVYVTNEDGENTSLNGNLLDVTPGVTIDATLSTEEIAASCADFFDAEEGSVAVVPIGGYSCIYNLYGHEACAAYCSTVAVDGEFFEVVLSCDDGEVLLCNPCAVAGAATGYGTDVDGNDVTFNTYRRSDDEPYILYDSKRNLRVYDACGETLIRDLYFEDNDGVLYYTDLVNTDEDGNLPVIRVSDGTVFCPYNGSINPETAVWKYWTRESSRTPDVLTSASQAWSNDNAVTAVSRVATAYDFYRDVLNRDGFDGKNGTVHIVVNDLGAQDGTAYSLTAFGTLTMLSFYANMNYDTVAHEYTHSVESSESGMAYQNESGSIMEALSDIFGELVENYATGKCDWEHGSRNLKNPKETDKPDTYLGENWGETYDNEDDLKNGVDRGHVHQNSTVISHAAYLMYYGIDGTESKKLSADQLAQLWYRAMLTMPSDCDFATCRKLVELAARSVNLTQEQIACVGEAFDKVGIFAENDHFDYEIGSGSTLTVLDANGVPYTNYICIISGTLSKNATSGNRSFYASYFENGELLELPNSEGSYTLVLYDKTDAPQRMSYRFKIDPYAQAENIKIATNYRSDQISASVIDAYFDQANYTEYGGRSSVAVFHIPKILIGSKELTKINQRIYDEFYDDVQYSLQMIEEFGIPTISSLTYDWWVNGDILTVMTTAIYYVDDNYAYRSIHSISISESREVTKSEILAACGFTEQEYHDLAVTALGSAFYDLVYPYKDSIFYNEDPNDYYERSISDENIERTQVFINEEGHLSIYGSVYLPVGNGSSEYVIDLEDFELSEYYGLPLSIETSSQEHPINLSEDEAYEIAVTYWSYTDGETDGDTGNQLYLTYSGFYEQPDGNHYYFYLLRWMTSDGILSTIDWVYVNAETGVCTYEIE